MTTTKKPKRCGAIKSTRVWAKSCDFCFAQEGRHYCLLHDRVMKNMNIKRCDDWRTRK